MKNSKIDEKYKQIIETINKKDENGNNYVVVYSINKDDILKLNIGFHKKLKNNMPIQIVIFKKNPIGIYYTYVNDFNSLSIYEPKYSKNKIENIIKKIIAYVYSKELKSD